MSNEDLSTPTSNLLRQQFQESATKSLTNPELISFLTEGVDRLAAVADALQATSSDTVQTAAEKTIDQDIIDSLVVDILGDQPSEDFANAAKDFRELSCKSTLNKDKKDFDPNSRFQSGVGFLIFANNNNRSFRRASTEKNNEQTESVIAFWQGNSVIPSSRSLKTIGNVIGTAKDIVLAEITDLWANKAISGESRVKGVLRANSKLDVDTNTDGLKFALATMLHEVLSRPVLKTAYEIGLGPVDPVNKDIMRQIQDSPLASMYSTTNFLASLDHNTDREFDRILVMEAGHRRGRLLGIPSREFKESIVLLRTLALNYRNLNTLDANLKEIKSENQRLGTMVSNDRTAKGVKQIVQGLQILYEIGNGIIDIHNKEYNGSKIDDLDVERAQYIEADRVRASLAQSFKDYVSNIGWQLTPEMRDDFERVSVPVLETHYEKIQERQAAAKKREAIERGLESFVAIDDAYHLSSKKNRERDPKIVPNAHLLSLHLSENGSVPETIARGLFAMISGAVWERTGSKATPAELAGQYISDASTLRQLQTELHDLGHDEPSKLLTQINLLDELIDSGMFDREDKYPEFRKYTDFVLAYMMVRDGEVNVTEPVAEAGSDDATEPAPMTLTNPPIQLLRETLEEELYVFPPGSRAIDLIRDYKEQVSEGELVNVEWDRIIKLLELRDHCQKQNLDARLIRTKHASWQVLPFFILEINIPGDNQAVAVIESPVYGNATYIYRESEERLSWREIVELGRENARELGANALVHVDSQQHSKHFKKVWNRVISELTVLR